MIPRSPRALVALSALAALALPAAAAAQQRPLPWSAGFHVDALWHLDRGYDVFTRPVTAPSPGLLVARDLATPTARTVAGVDLGWRSEQLSGTLHGTLPTALTTNVFSAGGFVRYLLTRGVQPYARVALGAAYLHARISTPDGNPPLRDSAWSPTGSAGAGILLRTGSLFGEGTEPRVGFALAVEGGWIQHLPAGFELEPEAPSDETAAADRVRVAAVPLGRIDPSGPYLRFAAALRF